MNMFVHPTISYRPSMQTLVGIGWVWQLSPCPFSRRECTDLSGDVDPHKKIFNASPELNV